MKNMKFFFYFKIVSLFVITFILICFVGCKEKDVPKTPDTAETEWSFKIEGLENSVDAYGWNTKLKIYSNKRWRLSVNKDWISIKKESGDVCIDTPIEVAIETEFNFYDDRDAILTLSVDNGQSNEKQEYILKQLKYQRPHTKYQVGDPEVTFDESKFDDGYKYNDQMLIWRNAGVKGGIPHIEDLMSKVTKVFEPGTTAKEIHDYLYKNRNSKPVVLLKNGNYILDHAIRIRSNSVLMGESRDGVVMTIDPKIEPGDTVPGFDAITLYGAQYAGLRNVTIIGGWLNEDGENKPKYENFGHTELDGMGSFMTVNMRSAQNCYIDNVRLVNSASHPVSMSGKNNTVRNVEMDGAFCKGGGCQGYFFIGGENQLITNCRVTRLRHISMQGEDSKYNVFYDNDLRQEFSFHVGDGGNNLIENNRIYLPPTMARDYNPIMGPWGSEHYVGGLNFIYMNKCKEDNREGKTPWSDKQLYLGPYEKSIGADNPTRYTNFRPVDIKDFPSGGTLYPIVLE